MTVFFSITRHLPSTKKMNCSLLPFCSKIFPSLNRLGIGGFLLLHLFALTIYPHHSWAVTEKAAAVNEVSMGLGLAQKDLEFIREETVSIAAAHEQPISEAPSNVYVITEEDIKNSGSMDLPTILRRIPGMEVIQMTGASFNVSMRGDNQLRANKLMVLIDGRSIYLDESGEVLWKTIPIALHEIKEIQVLKGPASVLYGFNAFDGIINIITKSPSETEGLEVNVGGGEFGSLVTESLYSGKYKDLSFRLSLGHNQTHQWEDRDSLAFRQYKFNVKAQHPLPYNGLLKLSGGLSDTNRFEGPLADILDVDRSPLQGYVQADYELPNFFLRLWWSILDDKSILDTNPLISDFVTITDQNGSSKQFVDWNSYNIESQYSLVPFTGNRVTLGFNYRHNAINSNILPNADPENRLGIYFQDEWNLTPKLTATTGLRFDMHSFINPTYSPRFALVYKPVQNHSFRGTFSMGYRPPTLFETYNVSLGSVFFPGFPPFVPPSTTVSTLKGSKDLDPEQIIATELGYQGWYWEHRIRLRVDLFYNHLSDLIGIKRPELTFVNSGEADIYGGEAEAEILLAPWISAFASYSYQDIYQTFTLDRRRGGPRFKINGGTKFNMDSGFSGEAVLHYVGSANYPVPTTISTSFQAFPGFTPAPIERVGSYFLLNLRGGYRFWNDKAEVAVSVFNALNDKHKEHPLGETIKSRIMGWLTIRPF